MRNTFARGFKTWCENVSLQKRRELELRSIDPLNPFRLGEYLGIKIVYANEIPCTDESWRRVLLADDTDSWSAVTLQLVGRALIILNPSHRKGREASDLMHELSHILIGHKPARVSVTEDGLLMLSTYDKAQEDEANWLAGCLLLPRDALVHIRVRGMEPLTAARTYGVSQQMLRYRLDATGVEYQLGLKRRRGS